MLTRALLINVARDHSLSPEQQKVYLLKILDNHSFDQVAAELGISKPSCLKRMGEVYRKFGIEGAGRGKEQRLRQHLLNLVSVVGKPTQPNLSENSLEQILRPWFKCIGYEFEDHKGQSPAPDNYFEWIIRVKARRGFDRIVVHGIHGEIKAIHFSALSEAVDKYGTDEGWVITSRRISNIARQIDINSKELFCYTFDELIDVEVEFDNYFDDLEEIVKQKSIVDSCVGTQKNASRYIDLACKKAEYNPKTQKHEYSYYGEKEGWIDNYIDLWLDDPAKEHISILGEFGTGKTWFAHHYAWIALQRYKDAKKRGLERPRIPLIIPLRDYAKSINLEPIFSDYLFRKHKIKLPNYSVFEQLNCMGKLLLIFDGFDEMAARVDHQSIVNNFWELAKMVVPGSKVILTCRTEHFPDAKRGRALLNAELRASTAKLTGESPQFEVLELEGFNNQQIEKLISLSSNQVTIQRFKHHPELMSLAKRPLMIELILDSLPDIEAGRPIDLARIYLYTMRKKMEEDIRSERTFTSLADKLYFLCELSWKILSQDLLGNGLSGISYHDFPDQIHALFGVESKIDLDHWHYDMMGQTILVRNENGEYSPAHKSFLEFFVAYKFAAELGCIESDFLELSQKQSCIDNSKCEKEYRWSSYFYRRRRHGKIIPIAPLGEFIHESISNLRKTLGLEVLSKTILDFILPMLATSQDRQSIEKKLLNLFLSVKQDARTEDKCLIGNLITLLLKISPSALQGHNLSHLAIQGVDFTKANLRDINFSGTHFLECIFAQGWGGDISVAFSRDGQYLAIVDSIGKITLWDVHKGMQVWGKIGHADWIRSIAFDASSKTFATGSHDKTVKLWDVQSGELIKTLNTGSRVYSVAFSLDYDYKLASSGAERNIKIWDLRKGAPKEFKSHDRWIGAVKFCRDKNGSEILASGSDDCTIRLWNLSSGSCINVLEAHGGSIQDISFDPETKMLASGSVDNTIRIWNIETGQCIKTLEGHTDWVRSVDFSPDGKQIASGSNDKTIRFWNIETGNCLRSIKAHDTRVWSVSFSPNKVLLASGSDDKTIKFWDIKTGKLTKSLGGNSQVFCSLSLSTDGQTIFAGSDDQCIYTFERGRQYNSQIFKGHKGRVRTTSLLEDRKVLVSGSDDKTIKLWHIETGECLHTYKQHDDWVWSVACSPNNKALVSGSLDTTVMIWDLEHHKHCRTLRGHSQFVWSVAWSPKDSVVASGSADQTIKLWDSSSGTCIKTLEGHEHHVTSISFSPAGDLLVSGSDDETIRVWEVETGECLAKLGEEDNILQISVVIFSPDGKQIVSGGLDGKVRIWALKGNKLIRSINTESGPVRSLTFSPDGNALVSGGETGKIKIWDISTGDSVEVLRTNSSYLGMNISDVHGLEDDVRTNLVLLGAVSN